MVRCGQWWVVFRNKKPGDKPGFEVLFYLRIAIGNAAAFPISRI